MYILTCPNCGSQEFEQVDYKCFECNCGANFELEMAECEEA